MADSLGVLAVGHAPLRGSPVGVSRARGAGTATGMNSDTVIAMWGLMGLAAAVLTGALWGTPLVMAPFRWFMR